MTAIDSSQISQIQVWLEQAAAVRERAYAPYSNFKVGALVIDTEGNAYKGVNVENQSYGLTGCAERNAIMSAVVAGAVKLSWVVVVADQEEPVSPCGGCRQIIAEFSTPDTKVVMGNLSQKYRVCSVDELLPYDFKFKTWS